MESKKKGIWGRIFDWSAEDDNRRQPVAIISDIHSNIEALDAVLKEIDRRGIREIICLGDIVGYGASPVECLERLNGILTVCLRGNHDDAVINECELDHFNSIPRAAMEWTRKQLSPDDRIYLAGLPYTSRFSGAVLTHSDFTEPEKWKYILYEDDARSNFGVLESDIGFFGHSHRPVIFEEDDGVIQKIAGGKCVLDEGRRYLINPGSVGQPRDRDPRASFAIFDPVSKGVEIVRVEYPVEEAREKILRAGLNPKLGNRLLIGK